MILLLKNICKKLKTTEERKQLKKIKRINTKKGKIIFVSTRVYTDNFLNTFSYSILLQNEENMMSASIDYHTEGTFRKIIEVINNKEDLIQSMVKDFSEAIPGYREYLKSWLLKLGDVLEDDSIKLLAEVS